jgi:hypothetical protein
MTNTTGTIIPALSQNDTNVNPHNPMYAHISVWRARRPAGSDRLAKFHVGRQFHGAHVHDDTERTPVKISSSTDSKGLVNTGQLSTLLPLPSDVTAVMESVKRISDAKYSKVTAYTDATKNTAALGTTGSQACGYTKAAYVIDAYGNPASVNPDVDPNIVGPTGIFTTPSTRQATTSRRPLPS